MNDQLSGKTDKKKTMVIANIDRREFVSFVGSDEDLLLNFILIFDS